MLLFFSLLICRAATRSTQFVPGTFYVVEHRQPYQSEFLWNIRLFLLIICFLYYSCKYTK